MSFRRRVVLLFSGGLDSTVLLGDLVRQGHQVTTLGVHYGQRHVRELRQAQIIAHDLAVPFRFVSVPDLGRLLSSDLTFGVGTKVVPNRNAVLVAAAVGYAVSQHCDAVALGINAGDARDFYDCRREFLDVLRAMARGNGVELWTPFMDMSKADVAALGERLSLPLDQSWSCYHQGPSPCGTCDACRDRAEARGAVPR